MTFEAFKRIRVKDETIEEFGRFMRTNDDSYAFSEKKKTDEKRKGKLADLLSKFNDSKQSAFPYIEDLGVDSIVIDEAHAFKNGATAVEFKGGKYLSLTEASARGLDAQLKTWYIRGQSPLKDGVLMLTATPITNSPLEIFSMLSLAVGLERVNNSMIGCRGAEIQAIPPILRKYRNCLVHLIMLCWGLELINPVGLCSLIIYRLMIR